MIAKPTIRYELHAFEKGHDAVIAIDEVGLGCLAGPVVVCATVFLKNEIKNHFLNLKDVHDSKLKSKKQREDLGLKIRQRNVKFVIGKSDNKVIDRIGIHRATNSVMGRVVARATKLYGLSNPQVLVDGPRLIKGIKLAQTPIIKGDQKAFSISCASILAKVFRDDLMKKYAKRYKGYGFEINKGYGTLIHRKAIRDHGPCLIHRKSFTLIKP